MTVSYTGSIRTYTQLGNDATTQNIFVLENGYQSRVNVNIRRLALQNDSLAVLTSVMPIARTSRATGISGGVLLEKTPFDTNQTSDTAVIARAQVQETARIAASAGTILWQQFTGRMHTAVEQQQGNDQNMLTVIVEETNKEFKLRPGEAILVQIVSPNAVTNHALINNFFVECIFEEEPIATFSISGVVTSGGVGVTGARVMVLEADDELMTNAFLRQVIITPAGGAWSSTIRTGKVGAAFVQYKDGATYYTAPGSPFLH